MLGYMASSSISQSIPNLYKHPTGGERERGGGLLDKGMQACPWTERAAEQSCSQSSNGVVAASGAAGCDPAPPAPLTLFF